MNIVSILFSDQLSTTTVVWLCVITIAFVGVISWIYIAKYKGILSETRRTNEQLASFLSTLGVLGTFWGITEGLIGFNANELENSIPILLNGLKTAFFTSLCGMISSVLVNAIVNYLYDEEDKSKPSGINQAAAQICVAVQQMSQIQTSTMQQLMTDVRNQTAAQTSFFNSMLQKMDKLDKLDNIETELKELILVKQNIESLVLVNRSQETTLTQISEITKDIKTGVGNVDTNVAEQLDVLSAMQPTIVSLHSDIESLSSVLKSEITDIEDQMTKATNLMASKFDEFTELLKKSNTEALVQVMKNATEEFQRTMGSLVEKLVKENFDQLNKSVENLNLWQQQNKQMIEQLTAKYQAMDTSFKATSDVFSKVAGYADSLSGTSGKLAELIKKLQAVMIEDNKFVEISKKLTTAAEHAADNQKSLNETATDFRNWITKQREFADSVRQLLTKLEDINKIKDYNAQYWSGTKQSLEEGVAIVKQGTTLLNSQLKELDKEFYGRLNATLAELDACIQAMVQNVNRLRR